MRNGVEIKHKHHREVPDKSIARYDEWSMVRDKQNYLQRFGKCPQSLKWLGEYSAETLSGQKVITYFVILGYYQNLELYWKNEDFLI